MVVFKKSLPLRFHGYRAEVVVQKGATILSVKAVGGETASIWFVCNPKAATEKRTFILCWTGQEIPLQPGEGARYVGTVVVGATKLVYHVFEAVKSEG